MSLPARLLPTGAVFWLLLAGAAPQDADGVLARMDQEAAAFRDLTARLTKVAYTAVLQETSQESGHVWMKRDGNRVLMKVEITQPEARSVALEGTTAQIYFPKIRTVQIYDLGKDRALIDQFSLLGFGTSRRDLERNYAIRLGGEETVEGRRTVRLELTPKSARVLERVRQVELWIPLDAGYPVRQRFLQPGGDYYLISYSDMRRNIGLADAACRLSLPPDVRREYPQK